MKNLPIGEKNTTFAHEFMKGVAAHKAYPVYSFLFFLIRQIIHLRCTYTLIYIDDLILLCTRKVNLKA